MCEIWKEIEGFDGYFVSNTGHVKGENGMLKETRAKNRIQIGIKKDGKWGRYDLHRLVAKAFLPNPYGLNTVNHKDRDCYNNHVDNLEWCSRSECPMIVRRRKQIGKEVKDNYNPRNRAVFQINMAGEVVGRFASINEASRETGAGLSGINGCLKGRLTTSRGFRWAYADEW